MAKLYQYKGSAEHYLKHGYPRGGYTYYTTYQIYPEVVHFLHFRGIRAGDKIPSKFFYFLRENDLIYTNNSGPGITESTEIPPSAKRSLDSLKINDADRNNGQEDISDRLSDPFGEDHDAIDTGMGMLRIPTIPWERQALNPINKPDKFTLPFEFFPHNVVHSFCIYDSEDHEYKLLRNYWRFFELSGQATYSNELEYNRVLGKFITLMSVIREIADIAYEDSFESHDERCDWFENMPFIRGELLERFGQQAFDDNEVVHRICESEIASVYSGIVDYYTDRDGSDCDFEGSIMEDARRYLTLGNDIEAHYCENHFFRETGLSPNELRALGFITNGFAE